MLLEHIEHIRTLPPHARQRYALLYTFLVTGCIVLVWISVLYFGSGSYLRNEEGVSKDTDTRNLHAITGNELTTATDALLEEAGFGGNSEDTKELPVESQNTSEFSWSEVLQGTTTPIYTSEISRKSGSESSSPDLAPQKNGSSTVSEDARFIEDLMQVQ
jgi:hypothetical protein